MKLTDEQIIKALECCIKDEFLCNSKCPGQELDGDYKDGCRISLMKKALDLINRQKAEIERLKKEKFDSLNCQFAEMYATTLEIATKKAKSEAIKEFAERLKEQAIYIPPIDDRYGVDVVFIEDIDYLVKEIIGEEDV